jgi:predicted DNA-binding transcriptional regulator YafY
MKTERLLSIIVLLLQRKKMSARELADHFEVSIRTIYRDVDSINLAGIPIVSYQGNEGGYEILSSFKLHNQVLNTNDLHLIGSALKGISSLFEDLKIESMVEIFDSYHAKNSSNEQLPLFVDFSQWGLGLPNKESKLLTLLKKSIEQKREIHFTYMDGNSSETKRYVQPASIIVKAGIPYLYAYCLQREDTRLFRVSRIREVTMTKNQFKPSHKVEIEIKDLEKNWMESSATIALTLIFSPKVKVLVEESFSNNQITYIADGYMKVDCRFPEGDWVVRFLLSFGKEVEIVEPESMRAKIKSEAKKILEMYE